MAVRIPTVASTQALTGLGSIYSVETPVGRGADNKGKSDVQLVQLFLRQFYILNPLLFKRLSKPTTQRNAQEILLDGKVGGQTVVSQFAVLRPEIYGDSGQTETPPVRPSTASPNFRSLSSGMGLPECLWTVAFPFR